MTGLWRWLRGRLRPSVTNPHDGFCESPDCLMKTQEHATEHIPVIEPDPEVGRMQERLEGLMQESSRITRRVYEEFDRRRELSAEENLMLRRRQTDK